jgi:hypothetical protein
VDNGTFGLFQGTNSKLTKLGPRTQTSSVQCPRVGVAGSGGSMSGMVVACGVSFLTGIACRHVCAARWSPLPLAPRRAARARAHGALTSARTRPQACGLRGCWALAQVVSEPTASPTLSMRCVCHACRLAHASRTHAGAHAYAHAYTHAHAHTYTRTRTRTHTPTRTHTQTYTGAAVCAEAAQ